MNRITCEPRKDYVELLENLSFNFHSLNNVYWDETAYYQFKMSEILKLEKVTNELWEMCLKAVQHVIDNKLYDKIKINPKLIPLIEKSWEEEHASVYGRFDLAYCGKSIKLLEFNADTPTSVYECGVVQWYWLQDQFKDLDQFNSIHERLVDYWNGCRDYFNGDTVHFCCVKDSIEDFTTVEYLRDCANQANLKTKFIYINDVGLDEDNNIFVDNDKEVIKHIFKLYPWEWLINEEFGEHIVSCDTKWIEPAWKSVLSNKGILPILYELNPTSEYILPCYFEKPKDMVSYVKKPIYSREGANVTIVDNGEEILKTEGEYGEEGYVYQEIASIPNYNGMRPIIGSWIIDGAAAGIGMRESDKQVTDNVSRFLPHMIED